MSANNSDLTKCVDCGVSRDEESFSGRYRNTCLPCARIKSRQYRFEKTGIMPKPYTEWKNGLRECTNCGAKKTEEDYSWRDTPSGSRILNSMCKECLSERQRARAKLPQTKEMMRKASQKYYHQGGGARKSKG